MAEDAKHRDKSRLTSMPSAMGRSHWRTQDELYREAVAEKPRFNRVMDFLKIKWVLWAWHYLKSRLGGKYEFQHYLDRPDDDGIYDLSAGDGAGAPEQPVRVTLAGDWASGTEDADIIGRCIAESEPHFTIHLGDIYYVGTKKEVRENMLGELVLWPSGSRGSFALNANHEMYARGKGFFVHLLPRLGLRASRHAEPSGQGASYFCLRNEHWLVIALDTGYYSVGIPFLEKIFKPSCKLQDEILAWLRRDVGLPDDDRRGVIVLSHHQYYSQFEKRHERAARQFSELIQRPVLWFWGHEHRLALYGKHATSKGRLEAYGRCLGHGGLPIEDIRDQPQRDKMHDVGLVYYDKRERTRLDDGTRIGFNGYATLEFSGPRLTIEYRDMTPRVLVRENWEVSDGGRLVGKGIEALVQDEDLVLHTGQLADAQR